MCCRGGFSRVVGGDFLTPPPPGTGAKKAPNTDHSQSKCLPAENLGTIRSIS